jgi:hypothetical protein
MARIDTLRLLRACLSELTRPPWVLALLFVGDLVELAGSLVLAATSPTPATPRTPGPAFDVPRVVPAPTLGVALVGVALGILRGASLVGEVVLIVRRMQILRWRYDTARRRRTLAGPSLAPAARANSSRGILTAPSSCWGNAPSGACPHVF